ncbi:hypothetical protein C7444_10544 [Sphaerotilus hippei]|uniref:Uncharacterized protein n=1 Tax=Sphaerotilus hippei TaxID=744406 RepID=A0A318H9I9_9BURK|nr:hypothetical protein [Sphaerotilus hippei]PXW96947.1 hypothetical protein C7444_10544 [Sphaerotilus hippei]
MLVFRWLVLLLLVGAAVTLAVYVGTRDRRWLRLTLLIAKWTVIAGLGFFGVLLLERLVMVV